MKDVLWPYPERLTSVEIGTPPRCFPFEISSEPASGCGDRYTFQRSPVVSPAVRGVDHKQGFSADSPASASWPRTPELTAEVFEDNPPTFPKLKKTMAGSTSKRTKSQQGKEKNRDAQRRFRKKQKDTIESQQRDLESQQRDMEGLKILLAISEQEKKAAQAKALLACERYTQLEKALQHMLPKKGNYQDTVCPPELAGSLLQPQMSELVAQIKCMQQSTTQVGEPYNKTSSYAFKNLVESAIQLYVGETKASNRDLTPFGQPSIGQSPLGSGVLQNKVIAQFVDDLQLQPSQFADICGMWTWFAQRLGELHLKINRQMTAMEARGGSVFEEEAINKQRKISEDMLLDQLTRGFFKVLFLAQQAEVITSSTQGALDIVVVIMYIAAMNELHNENLVQGTLLQQYEMLCRPAT